MHPRLLQLSDQEFNRSLYRASEWQIRWNAGLERDRHLWDLRYTSARELKGKCETYQRLLAHGITPDEYDAYVDKQAIKSFFWKTFGAIALIGITWLMTFGRPNPDGENPYKDVKTDYEMEQIK